MWKAGKWEYVGEVMAQGNSEKRQYEGDRFFPKGDYDYVFEVDIAEGAPKSKLPYNEGENPLIVAEKFLTREGMNMGYKEQITEFIRKNTKGGGKPLPGGQTQKPKEEPKKANCFPMRETVFYKDMNIDGLMNKLKEFHGKLVEAGTDPSIALTEHEFKYVISLAVKLRDPALYAYVKEFSSFEIEGAKKVTKWPAEYFVPIMDLWRCVVVHHASQVFFSGVDSGMPIIASLVGKLKNGPPVIWNVYCKFLSNLFLHTSNCVAIVRSKDIIQESFKLLNKSDEKIVALFANYLMNCSSSLDCISNVSDEFVESQILMIGDLALTATLSSESLLKLAIALGNFVTSRPHASKSASAIMQTFIEKMRNAQDSVSKSIVESFSNLSA